MARVWRAAAVLGCAAGMLAATVGPAWQPAATLPRLGAGGAAIAGRIAALVPDAAQPGTVYAAGLGGIWMSSDNGLHWKPLSGALPVAEAGALALDPSTPGLLYAGTGDPNGAAGSFAGIGLLRTGDGGTTWTVLGAAWFSGLAIARVEVDTSNPQHLLVATVTAADSPAGVQPGLYASSNGGQTWSQEIAGEAWDFAWDDATQTIIAAVGTHLYRSTDDGASFSVVSGATVPAVITRAAVCTTAAPGGFLVVTADAGFQLGALLSSTDDGQSWSAVPMPAGVLGAAGAGQGYYDIAVAADAADARHWWVGGVDVWETHDAGQSWTNLTGGAGSLVHSAQHALAPANGGVWIGNDGGVWWEGAGGNLTNLNAGLANAGVVSVAADSGSLWAGSFENGLEVLSPGAAAWQVEVDGAGGTVAAAAGSPQQLYYAWLQMTGMQYSTDAGAQFSPSTTTGLEGDSAQAGWRVPLAVDPQQPATAYAGTWRVWKTTDGGATWTALSGSGGQGTVTALAVSPVDSSQVWAGTSTGAVLHSGDGGATWAVLPATGLPARAVTSLVAAPGASGALWASLDGRDSQSALPGHVFTSSTGGASWTNVSSGLADAPVFDLLMDPLDSQVVYAATAGGVEATGDGGASWAQLGSGLPDLPVYGLAIDGSRDLLAGTFGQGVWKLPLASSAESLAVASGNGQSGAVDGPLAQPLQVTVLNAFGLPVEGVSVQWSDGGAGGSFSSAATASDANGIASVTYTLPSKAGSIAIQASLGASTVNFAETANALAQPSQLQAIGGGQQSGVVNTALGQPLSARAVDKLGNGVPGVQVAFTDGGAGGSFSADTVTTDANGMAEVTYTLPPGPGTVTATASVAGLPAAAFTETATPAPDFQLVAPASVPSVNQNTVVKLAVATTQIGGDTTPIQLLCTQPVTGCAFSPDPVTPGQTATLALASGSLVAGAADSVVVEGTDGLHTHEMQFSINVIAMGLGFGPAPSPVTVNAGQAAKFGLTLTPAGGLTGAVQLAVAPVAGGSLPTGMTAGFAPASLTLSGSGAVADTLTLQTTSRALAGVAAPTGAQRNPDGRKQRGMELPLAGLIALLGLAMASARKRAPGMRALGLGLLLSVAVACGGGGAPAPQVSTTAPQVNPNGTPAGTYDLTVTATAGSVSASTTVEVVVN